MIISRLDWMLDVSLEVKPHEDAVLGVDHCLNVEEPLDQRGFLLSGDTKVLEMEETVHRLHHRILST